MLMHMPGKTIRKNIFQMREFIRAYPKTSGEARKVKINLKWNGMKTDSQNTVVIKSKPYASASISTKLCSDLELTVGVTPFFRICIHIWIHKIRIWSMQWKGPYFSSAFSRRQMNGGVCRSLYVLDFHYNWWVSLTSHILAIYWSISII